MEELAVVTTALHIGFILGGMFGWLFYALLGAALVIVVHQFDRHILRHLYEPLLSLFPGHKIPLLSLNLMRSILDVNAAILAVYTVTVITKIVEQSGKTYPFGGSYWMVYFMAAIIYGGLASGVRFGAHMMRSA